MKHQNMVKSKKNAKSLHPSVGGGGGDGLRAENGLYFGIQLAGRHTYVIFKLQLPQFFSSFFCQTNEYMKVSIFN